MAHFNLVHDNSRGKTVSVGEPTHAHIRGWHAGVNVEARVQGGRDVFYVWMTSGSDQQHVSELIGVVDGHGDKPTLVTPDEWRERNK